MTCIYNGPIYNEELYKRRRLLPLGTEPQASCAETCVSTNSTAADLYYAVVGIQMNILPDLLP